MPGMTRAGPAVLLQAGHASRLALERPQPAANVTRRAFLDAAQLLLLTAVAQQAIPPPAAAAAAAEVAALASGPPAPALLPPDARAYWDWVLATIRSQLGDDFTAQLLVYTRATAMLMPSGAPGDPAMDFASARKGREGSCGVFQPGEPQPYALCPPPGQAAADDTTTQCCRHYAYCVPYSKLGLAKADRSSAVVVAPRLFLLPPERWQAVLAHEAGHAIDFWLFGRRYGLTDHLPGAQRIDPALRAALLEVDASERDPELRADLLGELLVLQQQDPPRQLCYDPALTLQVTLPPGTRCDGDGSGSAYMRHYKHAPIQGKAR